MDQSVAAATNGLTLDFVRAHREEILRLAAAHRASNVRIFGSVARGEANVSSDVDFLVDIDSTGIGGFEYFGLLEDLRRDLESLLGHPVDVGTSLQSHARGRAMHDVVQL